MRFNDFKYLTPILEMAGEALDSLKTTLASKIKTLPADEATVKTLREIEDLLRDVNAGGRTGLLNKDLQSVNDPVVREAHMLLARYINQILSFGNATPEDRKELFDLWKADRLVNLDTLLGGDLAGFTEIFNGYNSNPIIQELVDELMVVSALGHGKGEFGLSVLSKSINKPASGKGDLLVDYKGNEVAVEVKTADMGKDKPKIDKTTGQKVRDKNGKVVMLKGKMSSARFGDQEVIPGPGYEAASKTLNDFVKSKGKTVGDSGLNIGAAIELLKSLKPEDSNTLMGLIRNSVKIVFGKKFEDPRPDYKAKLTKNINGILSSIEKGDINSALQFWSRASFNYYMAAKHDDGVLFINIPAKTSVYYNSAEDLQGKGLRLDADTTYLSGSDPKRTVYPQIKVVPRNYGSNVIAPGLEKASKQGRELKTPAAIAKQVATQKADFTNWATKFADQRQVTDQRIIPKIADAAYDMKKAGVPTDAVIAELEQQFPQLVKNVVRARQIPSANRLYTPYVPPTEDEPEAA
jgi:hypothetical protein